MNHGFEIRLLRRSLAASRRGFTFYVADPLSSIHGFHGLGSGRRGDLLKPVPSTVEGGPSPKRTLNRFHFEINLFHS